MKPVPNFQENAVVEMGRLLALVPDAMLVTNRDGAIVVANTLVEQLFGYGHGELLGQPVEVLLPERVRHKHESHRAGYLRDPKPRAMGAGLELTGLRKDGTEFPVEISLNAFDVAGEALVVAAIRDVTERKAAAAAAARLAHNEQIRSRIVSEAVDHFVKTHSDPAELMAWIARYVVASIGDGCVIRLLSEDRQYLDVGAIDHNDPEALACLRELLAARREQVGEGPTSRVVLTGEPYVVPVVPHEAFVASLPLRARPFAEAFAVHSLLAVVLRDRGTIIGSLAVARTTPGRPYTRDEQTLLEDLAWRAATAIQGAKLRQDLKGAVQVREDFLSIAGHELKTPLAALLLQLQGIQRAVRKDPAAPVTERLEKALGSGLRMERLINELLDVSRIAAGKLQLEPAPCDLAELLREVAARFADANANANSTISIQGETQVNGHWDCVRLDQVITNLLGNAVKYGQSKPISVELRVDGKVAVLRVTDHGIGIDEEHQKKIFQRFERAVATREFGGFGLGLWITRQIVEASAGTIEVQSTAGQGSVFTVRLPIEPQQQPSEGHHAVES